MKSYDNKYGSNKYSRIERKRELYSKLENLACDLVTDTEKIDQFALSWAKGLRSYSFPNQLLIWYQYPTATICSGIKTWNKHNRYVKKGSKGIDILAPGIYKKKIEKNNENSEKGEKKEIEEVQEIKYFFPVKVFAYEQTEGEELDIGASEYVKGKSQYSFDNIVEKIDIPVKVSQGIENASTDGKKIIVSARKNKEQMVSALIHELAHVYLGHCYKEKNIPREIKELEAESTSYLVSSCIGIINEKAKYYISHWHRDKSKVKKNAFRIISAAEKILDDITDKKKVKLD